jgi:hypothetical protein
MAVAKLCNRSSLRWQVSSLFPYDDDECRLEERAIKVFATSSTLAAVNWKNESLNLHKICCFFIDVNTHPAVISFGFYCWVFGGKEKTRKRRLLFFRLIWLSPHYSVVTHKHPGIITMGFRISQFSQGLDSSTHKVKNRTSCKNGLNHLFSICSNL